MEGKALSPALEARIREAVTAMVAGWWWDCTHRDEHHAEVTTPDAEMEAHILPTVRALVSAAQREQREADARAADKIAAAARKAANAHANDTEGADALGITALDGEHNGAKRVATAIRGEGGA